MLAHQQHDADDDDNDRRRWPHRSIGGLNSIDLHCLITSKFNSNCWGSRERRLRAGRGCCALEGRGWGGGAGGAGGCSGMFSRGSRTLLQWAVTRFPHSSTVLFASPLLGFCYCSSSSTTLGARILTRAACQRCKITTCASVIEHDSLYISVSLHSWRWLVPLVFMPASLLSAKENKTSRPSLCLSVCLWLATPINTMQNKTLWLNKHMFFFILLVFLVFFGVVTKWHCWYFFYGAVCLFFYLFGIWW